MFNFLATIYMHSHERHRQNIRWALPVVHPCGRGETLVNRGHKVSTGVEVEHEEQVSCGASHSARAKETSVKHVPWMSRGQRVGRAKGLRKCLQKSSHYLKSSISWPDTFQVTVSPAASTSRCRPWPWRSPVGRWTQRRSRSTGTQIKQRGEITKVYQKYVTVQNSSSFLPGQCGWVGRWMRSRSAGRGGQKAWCRTNQSERRKLCVDPVAQ